MKNKIISIKKRILIPEKRSLLESFLSLSTLNILNYLFPIITVPYLVRVLGVEKYGLVNFAQAFVQYFVILTDYGFGLSATQEIAVARSDIKKISRIFSSVITIKILFCLCSSVILTVVVFLVPKFSDNKLLYLYSFGSVLSSVLFPIWFFQGMEQMRYITILNTISRIIFTGLIFVFIKTSADYLYVPVLTSFGGIVIGILSLRLVFTNFKIPFSLPSKKEISEELAGGWHIFLSQISISLYSVSNTFILGLLTNNVQVGYYAGAEKIMRVVKSLMSSITQSLFPYVNKRMDISKEDTIRFIRKILLPLSILVFMASAGLLFFAPIIVRVILGSDFYPSINIMRIMAFIPFFVLISNILGIQIMLPLHYKKAFSYIIILAGIINVLLLLVFIPFFKAFGAGLAVFITEIYVCGAFYIFLNHQGINILKRMQ